MDNNSGRIFLLQVFALLLLFFIFIAPLLGVASVWGSSEAREIHVVDTMVREQSWILPLRDGIIPSKPVGFHWAAAALSLLFGKVSPAIVRVVSLLSGLVLAGIAGLFAYGISPYSDRRRIEGSCAALAIALSTYLWIRMAVDARVDMFFAMWVSAAIYAGCASFGFGRSGRENKPSMLFLFWGACSAAVLTKGPLGLALPVLIVGTTSVLLRGWRRTFSLFLLPHLGWVFFAGITFSWYALATAKGGDAFLWRQLFFENIERITGSERMNSEPFWYYIPETLRVFAPWSLVLALVASLRWWEESRRIVWSMPRRPESSGFVWMALGLIFFSVVSGKRSSYLLPLLPGFAASSGIFLQASFSYRPRFETEFCRTLTYLAFAGLAACFILLVCVRMAVVVPEASNYRVELARWWLVGWEERLTMWLTAALLVGGGVMLTTKNHPWMTRIFLLSVLAVMFLQLGLGLKGQFKGFELFAENVKAVSLRHPTSPLVAIRGVFDEYLDPVLYYLRRPVKIIQRCAQLDEPAVVFGKAEEAFPCCSDLQMHDFKSFREPGKDGELVTDRLLVVGLCIPPPSPFNETEHHQLALITQGEQ